MIKGKREANTKIGAAKDEKITIRAEGEDTKKAVKALVALVSKSEH